MKTGDLILFKGQVSSWFLITFLIEFFSWSPWVHVGIVLEDPVGLKGLYLWESVYGLGTLDPEDHKKKFGVQLSSLPDRLKGYNVYTREYQGLDISTEEIEEVHKQVHDKPYDIVPLDWLEAVTHVDLRPKKVNRFWCSALVGYILTKLHVIHGDVDWSILSPKYFANFDNNNYGPIKSLK